jgi:gas vesicle protein
VVRRGTMGRNRLAGSLAVGILVGGVAGAATALLLAPQSGEDTRKQVQKKALEWQTKAEQALNEASAKANEAAADMERRAKEMQAQARVVLEEGQRQLARAMTETKKAAQAATGEARETDIVTKPREIPVEA